ncbi:MAG: transposase [Anaerolineae bacterium]|nr:transposase [Anaerolineae bacterium]
MFFEGIRSERQLMAMVAMRLDCRWFIGYDLDEAVPDHSSLSKIRDRYGLEVFQQFFEHIVALCIEAGLVWGKELYFDGTQVRGNASMDSLAPRIQVHLAAQVGEAAPATTEDVGTEVATEASPAPSWSLVEVQRRAYPRADPDHVLPPDHRCAGQHHPTRTPPR